MERIDKLIANGAGCTRKEAKQYLSQGRVSVAGVTVKSSDAKFDRNTCIKIDGKAIDSNNPLWIMLHKPSGYVTATEDREQKTVMELVPSHMRRRGLFPVGRLDKDTEGLLLLTDDGEMAHRLLSPKYHVDKTYYLEVDGVLTQREVTDLAEGLQLGDGLHCLPATLVLLEGGASGYITLHEGKYHQIKRMMATCKAPVTYLKRVAMGGVFLDDKLKKGEWRPLTVEEIHNLTPDDAK